MFKLLSLIGVTAFASTVSASCTNGWCHMGDVANPTEATIPLTFAVKQQNVEMLKAYLHEVSNPESDNYGKYLTLDEIHEMTSVPESADALMEWLALNGVTSEATIGKDFVVASVTAEKAAHLFDVDGFSSFEHEKSGQIIHRASSLLPNPVPEKILDHVDFVHGLFELPSPLHGAPIAPQRTLTYDDMYGDATFASDAPADPETIIETYNIKQASKIAPGNTMSVIEALGQQYSEDDLQKFLKYYGLPEQTVAKVVGNNDGTVCKRNPNNCAEANLDVQYMMAVAQNVPMTYWSIDANDQTPFLDWIVAVANTRNPPLVHSVSYGEVENAGSGVQTNTIKRINTEFMKSGARGLTITVASGDDGVANFQARQSKSACGFNPSFPASSPYVLAVGATQFKGGRKGASEIGQARNNKPSGGITTGGGFSTLFDMPSYQKSVVTEYLAGDAVPEVERTSRGYPAPGFNAAGRGYPDVSALGHHYPVNLGGNMYQLDGTSASSPVVAGMLALVNNERLLAGKSPLGFVNPLIYKLAESNPSVFNDVTEGENRCCAGSAYSGICCDNGFTAVKGWDPVSGLGTINYDKLLEAAK